MSKVNSKSFVYTLFHGFRLWYSRTTITEGSSRVDLKGGGRIVVSEMVKKKSVSSFDSWPGDSRAGVLKFGPRDPLSCRV